MLGGLRALLSIHLRQEADVLRMNDFVALIRLHILDIFLLEVWKQSLKPLSLIAEWIVLDASNIVS